MAETKEVDIKITKVTVKEREMRGGKMQKGVIHFFYQGEKGVPCPPGVDRNKLFRKHLPEVMQQAHMGDYAPASLAWSKKDMGFIGRTSLPHSVVVEYKLTGV
jgi:hypothetical protein